MLILFLSEKHAASNFRVKMAWVKIQSSYTDKVTGLSLKTMGKAEKEEHCDSDKIALIRTFQLSHCPMFTVPNDQE
jgi:hypothetical protein